MAPHTPNSYGFEWDPVQLTEVMARKVSLGSACSFNAPVAPVSFLPVYVQYMEGVNTNDQLLLDDAVDHIKWVLRAKNKFRYAMYKCIQLRKCARNLLRAVRCVACHLFVLPNCLCLLLYLSPCLATCFAQWSVPPVPNPSTQSCKRTMLQGHVGCAVGIGALGGGIFGDIVGFTGPEVTLFQAKFRQEKLSCVGPPLSLSAATGSFV